MPLIVKKVLTNFKKMGSLLVLPRGEYTTFERMELMEFDFSVLLIEVI